MRLLAQVHHYVVRPPGQDCFRRLVGDVALDVGHMSRNKYEVAGSGIDVLFEVFAEADTYLAFQDVSSGLRFPMMMGWTHGIGLTRYESQKNFAGSRRVGVNTGLSSHTPSLSSGIGVLGAVNDLYLFAFNRSAHSTPPEICCQPDWPYLISRS